jgi:hypothetical protein
MSPYFIHTEDPRAREVHGVAVGTLRLDLFPSERRRPHGRLIIAKPKGGTARGGLVRCGEEVAA